MVTLPRKGKLVALTDIEKEWVTELVENTATKVADVTTARILELHVATCPYGKRLARFTWIAIGVGIGSGVGGGTIVIGLFKLLQSTAGGG